MFGCRTTTLIPTTSEILKPKIGEDVQGKILKRKQLQAKHYNISAEELPPPPPSKREIVCVKPTDRSGRWFKAHVEQQVDHVKSGLRMERSSEEIEDTSEAVRSQRALGTALSPSTC